MINLVRKFINSIREEGILISLGKVCNYANSKVKTRYREIIDKLKWLYYRNKSYFIASIENIEAKFTIDSRYNLRWTKLRIDGEKDTISNLISELNDDDVFYDIGANTGVYTCFALNKPCKEVIAFEPYPPNVRSLRKNITLNDGNATIMQIGLSNIEGTDTLSVPEEETPGCGNPSIMNQKSKKSIEIDIKRGDNLIEEGKIPQPNIIKLDVEGAELMVLKGLEKAISKVECRTIYCEVHEKKENTERIEKFLEQKISTLREGTKVKTNYI